MAQAPETAQANHDSDAPQTRRPHPLSQHSEERRIDRASRYLVDDSTALDELAEEAIDVFGADRAAVRILTGSRQHTAASTLPTRRTIDRSEAVCRYTILTDDVMVVDDLTAEQEFHTCPDVMEDGMQWYAGAPITIDGQPVGTFCIEDSTPGRDLLTAEEELLQSYADRAAVVLAFRYYRQEAGYGIDEAIDRAFDTAS